MDKRRSSILKPKKERNPFAEVDFTSTAPSTDTDRFSKKVRFSSNFVKAFTTENDNNTVWDNTYEEVINNMTESSQESTMGITQPLKEITNVSEEDVVSKQKTKLTESKEISQKSVIKSSIVTRSSLKGDSRKTINFNSTDTLANMDISRDISIDKPGGSNLNKTLIFQNDFDLSQTSLLKDNDGDSKNCSTDTECVDFVLGKGNIFIPVKVSKNKGKSKKSKSGAKNKSALKDEKVDDLTKLEKKEMRKTIVFDPANDDADMEITKVCADENLEKVKLEDGKVDNKGKVGSIKEVDVKKQMSLTKNSSFKGKSLLNKIKDLKKIVVNSENVAVGNESKKILESLNKNGQNRKTILFNTNNEEGNMEMTLQVPVSAESSVDCEEKLLVNQGNFKKITTETSRKTILFNETKGDMEITLQTPVVSAESTLVGDVEHVEKLLPNKTKIVNGGENLGKTSRKTIIFNQTNEDANMEMTLQTSVPSEQSNIVNKETAEGFNSGEQLLKTVQNSRKTILFNPSNEEGNMEMTLQASVLSEESNVNQTSRKTILFNPSNEDANMEMSLQVTIQPENSEGSSSNKKKNSRKSIAANSEIITKTATSRKTILFNPTNEEGNMEMTLQAPSEVEESVNIEENCQKNGKSLLVIEESSKSKVPLGSSRKTILFNPAEEEANMEMSVDVSVFEQKQQSRKTIVFNQTNQDGDMEITLHTSRQMEENKLVVENPLDKTCKSRKTIVFNQTNQDGDMEITLNAPRRMEENKLVVENPLDKTCKSRKTIVFNQTNQDGDMEITLNAPRQMEENKLVVENPLDKTCKSRKTIVFNQTNQDGDMEISLHASRQMEENNLIVENPLDKTSNVVKGSSRKTIVFNPDGEEGNMEMSIDVNGSSGKCNSRKTIHFNPEDADMEITMKSSETSKLENATSGKTSVFIPDDDRNMDAYLKAMKNEEVKEIVEMKAVENLASSNMKAVENLASSNMELGKSEPTTPNFIQTPLEKSKFLSGRKTFNRTTMDFNLENKKIFHSTGVDFGDKTEIGDEVNDGDRASLAQYEQKENVEIPQIVIEDETNIKKTKVSVNTVGNQLEVNPVGSQSKLFDKVAEPVPLDNISEDGKANQFLELLTNENVTTHLTNAAIALSDVTVGFGAVPRSFCRNQTTFSPSTDDTQHLINYKLKDEKYQKSDFSKIISGEMQVDHVIHSPVCFSTNMSSAFSDTAEIDNILQQKTLNKTNLQRKSELENVEVKVDEDANELEVKDENLKVDEIEKPKVNEDLVLEEIEKTIENRSLHEDSNEEIKAYLSERHNDVLMETIFREHTVINISDESIGIINSPQITNTIEESLIDLKNLNTKEFLLHCVRFDENLKNDPNIAKLGDDLLRREKKTNDLEQTKLFIKKHNELVDKFQMEIESIIASKEKTECQSFICEEKPKSLQEKVQQYVKKYDTISCFKFTSSKECVFETLHGTIKLKVSMNICGVILTLIPLSQIDKETSETTAMLINSLFMEKLQPSVIELSVGKPFTIYTLLDYVDTTMCVFDKFDDDFSELQAIGLEMDHNYRVTLPIVDMKLLISWRIYIDFSNCELTKDRVTCKCVVGNINEEEIKNLVPTNSKRGLQGLINYLHSILDYVREKRKRKVDGKIRF